jgi:8-oxo-dGTP diphosphatase
MASGQDNDRGPQLAVRAIILDPEQRVLLVKRAAGSTASGAWCLPGGKVELGQTAEEAVRTEIAEETALDCVSAEFLFYQDSLPRPAWPAHFLNLYFFCTTTGQVVLNGESSDFCWASVSQARDLEIAFRNDEALARYWALGRRDRGGSGR